MSNGRRPAAERPLRWAHVRPPSSWLLVVLLVSTTSLSVTSEQTHPQRILATSDTKPKSDTAHTNQQRQTPVARQIPHHIQTQKWLSKRQSDASDQPQAEADGEPVKSSTQLQESGSSLASRYQMPPSSVSSSPIVNNRPQAPKERAALSSRQRRSEDVCADRLCYGLPMGCLDRALPMSSSDASRLEPGNSLCSVLVTSKRLIDPYRPVARDIHFELFALPIDGRSNYAAVGFSETGRMSGLVTECLQYRDSVTQLQIIKLAHSYNIPGAYNNVPANILSGVKNLGVSYENGYYQCRWVVESAVEFTYEDPNNGTLVNKREDLGYRNYHILLASGVYDEKLNYKHIHTDRVSSMTPISLAQTGHIKSLGSHILIRIHGSLMVFIWIGLVTISVILARYYKNEWANSKINDLAIWFVLHRALMLTAWFGSIIAVIFAYLYTETYHAGAHQIAGTTCLVLSTIQVLGGLLRPSMESDKRVYFNWTHFACGNLSYLFAMTSIVTAAFLAPAHLPPLYIWVVVAFVAIYALTHLLMTIHQYIVHKSSKISITPKGGGGLNGDLGGVGTNGLGVSGEYVKDSYPFRQVMLGVLVAIVIFIVLVLLWIITIRAT